jgi:GTPase SAR1 family protein
MKEHVSERWAFYLIGEPGVGKSTLMEELTRDLPYEEAEKPFPIRRYDCGVVELGKRRESFSGTDAYAMNVQPMVEQWLEGVRPRMVMAEGDRLANGKFFQRLVDLGYDLTVYHLYGPEQAEIRRSERGSHQDPTWLKGRVSKVEKLNFQWLAWHLPADLTPSGIVELMKDPVSTTLRQARPKVDATIAGYDYETEGLGGT